MLPTVSKAGAEKHSPPPKKKEILLERETDFILNIMKDLDIYTGYSLCTNIATPECAWLHDNENISGILISIYHVNSLVGRWSFFRIKAEN